MHRPDGSRVLQAFKQAVVVQAQNRARRRRAAAARHQLEAWRARAEEAVMRDLAGCLERHARQIGEALGITIAVAYPSTPPLVTGGGDRMRFLCVAFAEAEVHAYTTRGNRGLPRLYVAHAVRSTRARFPRLLSVPGYVVVRGPGGTIVLADAAPRAEGEHVTVEEVACRLLEMLAGAARSRCEAAVA